MNKVSCSGLGLTFLLAIQMSLMIVDLFGIYDLAPWQVFLPTVFFLCMLTVGMIIILVKQKKKDTDERN